MAISVLIVDDEQAIRTGLREILESKNFKVSEASDGQEALHLFDKVRPRVVVMDIAMPRMDGLEATRRIKKKRPHTKVIILTVHNETVYQKAGREAGADLFLFKKMAAGKLVSSIEEMVGPSAS